MARQGSEHPDEMSGVDRADQAVLRLFFVSVGDDVGGFIYPLYPEARLPGMALGLYVVWVLLALVRGIRTFLHPREHRCVTVRGCRQIVCVCRHLFACVLVLNACVCARACAPVHQRGGDGGEVKERERERESTRLLLNHAYSPAQKHEK